MPRPPILSAIKWKDVFESGKTYQDWISAGEDQNHCSAMENVRKKILLESHIEGGLQRLHRTIYIVAFAEDWCGDVVRHVPVLQALVDASPNINVRYITRNHHPDIFSRFLTNGGEAIPKFIFLNNRFIECGNWGPMPELCREIIARGKACGDVATARKKVASRYEFNDEYRREVIIELLHCIDIAVSSHP